MFKNVLNRLPSEARKLNFFSTEDVSQLFKMFKYSANLYLELQNSKKVKKLRIFVEADFPSAIKTFTSVFVIAIIDRKVLKY